MMNSLDYQNTRFSNRMGQSWLRPDYANSIEHYKPMHSNWGHITTAFMLVVLSLAFIGVVYGG